MQKYLNNVQDTFGNAIGSVTVTVRTNPGGVLATLFSDNAGTAKANPFTNDSDGEFFFYSVDGRYDVELTGPVTETKADIRLLDVLTTGTSLRINTDIVTATPPTTETVIGTFDIFDLANNDKLAHFGFAASAALQIKNFMHGGSVELQGQNNAGANINLFTADPDGNSVMFYAGGDRLACSTTDVNFRRDDNLDTTILRLRFQHDDTSPRALIGFNGSGTFNIRNEVHGSNVNIAGEDAGGVLRNFLTGDPDGQTILYSAGVAVGATNTTGRFNVMSVGNTDTEGRFLNLTYQNQTVRGGIGYNANDILLLRNLVHSGHVQVTAEDAGGTTRTILDGDPDGETVLIADTTIRLRVGASITCLAGVSGGSVNIYYNGQANLRTSAEAGNDIGMGAEVRHNDDSFYPVGMNVLPEDNGLDSGTVSLLNVNVGKMLTYNTATARSLTIAEAGSVKVGASWALIVGPSAGVLTGNGTGSMQLRWWNGTGWTTTAAAGNITIGVGQYTIWKETDTLYWISGPTLS